MPLLPSWSSCPPPLGVFLGCFSATPALHSPSLAELLPAFQFPNHLLERFFLPLLLPDSFVLVQDLSPPSSSFPAPKFSRTISILLPSAVGDEENPFLGAGSLPRCSLALPSAGSRAALQPRPGSRGCWKRTENHFFCSQSSTNSTTWLGGARSAQIRAAPCSIASCCVAEMKCDLPPFGEIGLECAMS